MDRTETNCSQTPILKAFAPVGHTDKKSGSKPIPLLLLRYEANILM
jgi:hypothetical protein